MLMNVQSFFNGKNEGKKCKNKFLLKNIIKELRKLINLALSGNTTERTT